MNTYKIANEINKKRKLDTSKKNILIIGSSNNNNQSNIILNPTNIETAINIYGENNPLVNAYDLAYSITMDSNIYTVNCPITTDFIEIIDTIMHYDFDYIVPINIYIDDTFINPISNKKTYFCNYYLERLGQLNNLSTILITDRPSYLYESLDKYLLSLRKIYKTYYNESAHILDNYGSNLVFTINNLNNIYYSNVLLAAILSTNLFTKYPDSIPFKTYYDIDSFDINNESISYFKYHENTDSCTIENLKNMKIDNDIYKWVLIDEAIKYVIRKLSLDEFNGRLYSPYVKLQINTRIKKLMDDMQGKVFKEYFIENIEFVKTSPAVGYINIYLSIVPFGTLEKINIVMGV